jgi:hypothetical protein
MDFTMNIEIPEITLKKKKKRNKTYSFSEETIKNLENLSNDSKMKPNAILEFLVNNAKVKKEGVKE